MCRCRTLRPHRDTIPHQDSRDINLLPSPFFNHALLPLWAISTATSTCSGHPCQRGCMSRRMHTNLCYEHSQPPTAAAASYSTVQPPLVSITSPLNKEPVTAPSPIFSTPPSAKRTRKVARRRCEVELPRDDGDKTDHVLGLEVALLPSFIAFFGVLLTHPPHCLCQIARLFFSHSCRRH
jgi:hypothetical protein